MYNSHMVGLLVTCARKRMEQRHCLRERAAHENLHKRLQEHLLELEEELSLKELQSFGTEAPRSAQQKLMIGWIAS